MKRLNKYIVITLVAISTFIPLLSYSQMHAVQFEQLDSLQKREKRPVVVFLHTTWCKYCGTMKNTTFKNDEVVKLLREKFYFISLDIEEKRDISFKGHVFRYKPTGNNTGVHELAEEIGTINGQMGYPSLCFLNADDEIIYQQEGYVSAKDLLKILKRLKDLSSEKS